jgi:hypothetical protein
MQDWTGKYDPTTMSPIPMTAHPFFITEVIGLIRHLHDTTTDPVIKARCAAVLGDAP